MTHRIPRPDEFPQTPSAATIPARASYAVVPAVAAGWVASLLLVAVLAFAAGNGGCKFNPWPSPGPTITDPGFGAMVVIEHNDAAGYTPSQLNAMNSLADGSLRATVSNAGGVFRLLDEDDSVEQDLPVIREVFKVERTSTPWLYVWKNRRLKSGPLVTEQAAIEAAHSLR